ncbi:MAG: hypothetical protein ABIQ13_06155 [Pedococcus sp.]
MTEQVPVGHIPDRGLTITLSTPFVESLTPEQLDHYVSTVVGLGESAAEASPSDLASHLRDRLEAGGVQLPPTSYDRLGEQLAQASGAPLSIITDRDQLLYGEEDATAAAHQPGAPDTADPEHPDRPTYS